MKLYHATSCNNLENIKENGLSGEFTKVRPGVIHLACDILIAENYHEHWEQSDTIIFSIEIQDLDLSKLGPDREDLMDILEQNEDERNWSDIDWKESLELSNNCTYQGIIPFDKLNIEKIIENENVFKIC